MGYLLFFLPPALVLIVFIAAMKHGFNKAAFFVSVGITMIINMFAIHHLTWYGLLCTLTIPLAGIYVVICLVLSIQEHRSGQ